MDIMDYASGVSMQNEPEAGYLPETFGDKRVVVLDSVTHAVAHIAAEGPRPGKEVFVNASYAGVYAAQFIESAQPAGWIGVDGGIGKDGAGIAGLWYFEALALPAAAGDINTIELGNGIDMYENGIISRVNGTAESLGIHPGMPLSEAASLMVRRPDEIALLNPTGRHVILTNESGRSIIATNSIVNALPEDQGRNVLCCAGHAGRSVTDYVINARPIGFIFSDGGIGKNDAGIACLPAASEAGIPGAAVSVMSACLGNGLSTYRDGVLSAVNEAATKLGIAVGDTARAAAAVMLAAADNADPAE